MKNILLSLVPLILSSLGVVGNTVSAQEPQQVQEPPLQGDSLQMLLGMRVESPAVVAMLNWAGLEPPTEPKTWVGNSAFELHFEHSRVSKISLSVDLWIDKPYWKAALPMGLEQGMKTSVLAGRAGWRRASDRSTNDYFCDVTWNLGDQTITRYKGAAFFNTQGKLRYLNMQVTPLDYWKHHRKLIQEMIPASKFDSEIWWSMVGADIASSDGDILAAWAGMPIDGPVGKRAGLKVTLVDHRWLDQISLSPEFEGSFPFGLTNPPTEAELNAILGDSFRNEGQSAIAHWAIISPQRWPLYIDLDHTDEKEPFLTLRCERHEVNTWMSTIQSQEAPSAALVDDILAMWNSARNTPDALLGRKEVSAGAFGEVITWNTNKCLLGVIGGTIRDSNLDVLGGPTRRMEFLLRSYPPDSSELVEAQLDFFTKALKERIEDDWELTRTAVSKKREASIRWAKKGLNLLERGPEIEIEAQNSAGAKELRLVISTPIK
jgi:hypothetical protein